MQAVLRNNLSVALTLLAGACGTSSSALEALPQQDNSTTLIAPTQLPGAPMIAQQATKVNLPQSDLQFSAKPTLSRATQETLSWYTRLADELRQALEISVKAQLSSEPCLERAINLLQNDVTSQAQRIISISDTEAMQDIERQLRILEFAISPAAVQAYAALMPIDQGIKHSLTHLLQGSVFENGSYFSEAVQTEFKNTQLLGKSMEDVAIVLTNYCADNNLLGMLSVTALSQKLAACIERQKAEMRYTPVLEGQDLQSAHNTKIFGKAVFALLSAIGTAVGAENNSNIKDRAVHHALGSLFALQTASRNDSNLTKLAEPMYWTAATEALWFVTYLRAQHEPRKILQEIARDIHDIEKESGSNSGESYYHQEEQLGILMSVAALELAGGDVSAARLLLLDKSRAVEVMEALESIILQQLLLSRTFDGCIRLSGSLLEFKPSPDNISSLLVKLDELREKVMAVAAELERAKK